MKFKNIMTPLRIFLQKRDLFEFQQIKIVTGLLTSSITAMDNDDEKGFQPRPDRHKVILSLHCCSWLLSSISYS